MELHKAKVEYQKLPSDYEIDKKLLYSNTESFQLNAYLTYFYIKTMIFRILDRLEKRL